MIRTLPQRTAHPATISTKHPTAAHHHSGMHSTRKAPKRTVLSASSSTSIEWDHVRVAGPIDQTHIVALGETPIEKIKYAVVHIIIIGVVIRVRIERTHTERASAECWRSIRVASAGVTAAK